MPDASLVSVACPLFVPLVENGYADMEATYLIAQDYLKSVIESGADTVILGCTHYPMLEKVISNVLGDSVTLINVGKAAAEYLKELLAETEELSSEKTPAYDFYASDCDSGFEELAEMFLNREIYDLKNVDIDKVTED